MGRNSSPRSVSADACSRARSPRHLLQSVASEGDTGDGALLRQAASVRRVHDARREGIPRAASRLRASRPHHATASSSPASGEAHVDSVLAVACVGALSSRIASDALLEFERINEELRRPAGIGKSTVGSIDRE